MEHDLETVASLLVVGVGQIPVRPGSLRVQNSARSMLWLGEQRIVEFVNDDTGEMLAVHVTAVAGVGGPMVMRPDALEVAERERAAGRRARAWQGTRHQNADPVAGVVPVTVMLTPPPGWRLTEAGVREVELFLTNVRRNEGGISHAGVSPELVELVMHPACQVETALLDLLANPRTTEEAPTTGVGADELEEMRA